MSWELYTRLNFLDKFPGTEVAPERDNLYTGWETNLSWNATMKNFQHISVWTSVSPAPAFDYFEPRIAGRFYEVPRHMEFGMSARTDTRKKVSLEVAGNYVWVDQKDRRYKSAELATSFRASSKFSFGYETAIEHARNDEGYVTHVTIDNIIFGMRDVIDVVNLIRAQYTFSPKMHVSLRMRHNWTRVQYNSFHQLTFDGKLAPSGYLENEDINFNAFTVDAIYRWRFAPGSDIFIVWKNGIIAEEEHSDYSYWRNLSQLTDLPMRNSLSLKVLYYLDVGRF
jgi:hypothetical protein